MKYFGTSHHELLLELPAQHSAIVDPQELSVPSSHFEALAVPSFNEAPHLRKAIMQAMWTSENAIPKQRPTPDQANLITASEINQMGKNQRLVNAAEKWIVNATSKITPFLKKEDLGNNLIKDTIREYSVALVRLMFSKKISHLGWDLPKRVHHKQLHGGEARGAPPRLAAKPRVPQARRVHLRGVGRVWPQRQQARQPDLSRHCFHSGHNGGWP